MHFKEVVIHGRNKEKVASLVYLIVRISADY